MQMQMAKLVPRKTLTERLVHALTFEATAIAICAPIVSWVLGLSLVHVGALTAAVSVIAMVWNVTFNALFERIERRYRLTRTLAVRAAHAIAFELGLVAMALPLAAWWLEISLLEALLLDFGILLFFLPYTFLFNLGYDRLRARWIAQRAVACR
ncbi:multidrug/biocide efflux PACE transporter [Burkholderia sp. MSMB1589WGS]|uniref:multidrug/biocide efflux PACE transporter n=1 Tax=Burkholderia sp. MSMB1589WGS TaxID=1636425 RepID=UPI0007B8D373|nr:multidrug/biocide efflux PACE transporter [Burkholderia sp. MSMB1589WGS]